MYFAISQLESAGAVLLPLFFLAGDVLGVDMGPQHLRHQGVGLQGVQGVLQGIGQVSMPQAARSSAFISKMFSVISSGGVSFLSMPSRPAARQTASAR